MQALLHKGDSIYQMMQVTGEEGITLEDFILYQKATLIDMVFLQQDAFDEVDVSMSRERQLESFNGNHRAAGQQRFYTRCAFLPEKTE